MFELVVGNARAALTQTAADAVREALEGRFGPDLGLDRSDAPYISQDIGWDGWTYLQEKAQSVIPQE